MSEIPEPIVVGYGDGLPDVLNRLRRSSGQAVAIEIPAESSLFLTASEFRALQAAAERDKVAISVATEDPLRQQLATLFKIALVTPGDAAPASPAAGNGPIAVPVSDPVVEFEKAPIVRRGLGQWARPAKEEAKEPPTPASSESDASETPAEIPTVAAIVEGEREVEPEVAPFERERASLVPRRLRESTQKERFIAVAGVLGMLAVLYLGAYLFLTRATVILTLKRQPISQDLTVALAGQAGETSAADLTLPVTPLMFDVSSRQSMEVTGTRTIGDGAARGKVMLSNPTEKAITVAAGTQVVDKITGTVFTIDKAVDVPAAKGGTPGFKAAEVTCLEAGTVGNRDLGLLSGRLASGVYYSNREAPIAGGTDKRVAVVAQADLDTLQARATEEMTAQAMRQTPDQGLVLVLSSVQLTDTTFTSNHQVDEPAATLELTATGKATASGYDPAALKRAVAAALQATTAQGYEIDVASLRMSDPSPGQDMADGTLVMRVEGSARAVVTDADRQAIAKAVAGGSEAEAREHLASLPAIAGFEISYRPGWLPHRIPSSSGRIDVEAR